MRDSLRLIVLALVIFAVTFIAFLFSNPRTSEILRSGSALPSNRQPLPESAWPIMTEPFACPGRVLPAGTG